LVEGLLREETRLPRSTHLLTQRFYAHLHTLELCFGYRHGIARCRRLVNGPSLTRACCCNLLAEC